MKSVTLPGGKVISEEDLREANEAMINNFADEEMSERKEKTVPVEDGKPWSRPPQDRRYAFEWYVREMDQWYWDRTRKLVMEKTEKAVTLTGISAAASWVAAAVTIVFLLRRS